MAARACADPANGAHRQRHLGRYIDLLLHDQQRAPFPLTYRKPDHTEAPDFASLKHVFASQNPNSEALYDMPAIYFVLVLQRIDAGLDVNDLMLQYTSIFMDRLDVMQFFAVYTAYHCQSQIYQWLINNFPISMTEPAFIFDAQNHWERVTISEAINLAQSHYKANVHRMRYTCEHPNIPSALTFVCRDQKTFLMDTETATRWPFVADAIKSKGVQIDVSQHLSVLSMRVLQVYLSTWVARDAKGQYTPLIPRDISPLEQVILIEPAQELMAARVPLGLVTKDDLTVPLFEQLLVYTKYLLNKRESIQFWLDHAPVNGSADKTTTLKQLVELQHILGFVPHTDVILADYIHQLVNDGKMNTRIDWQAPFAPKPNAIPWSTLSWIRLLTAKEVAMILIRDLNELAMCCNGEMAFNVNPWDDRAHLLQLCVDVNPLPMIQQVAKSDLIISCIADPSRKEQNGMHYLIMSMIKQHVSLSGKPNEASLWWQDVVGFDTGSILTDIRLMDDDFAVMLKHWSQIYSPLQVTRWLTAVIDSGRDMHNHGQNTVLHLMLKMRYVKGAIAVCTFLQSTMAEADYLAFVSRSNALGELPLHLAAACGSYTFLTRLAADYTWHALNINAVEANAFALTTLRGNLLHYACLSMDATTIRNVLERVPNAVRSDDLWDGALSYEALLAIYADEFPKYVYDDRVQLLARHFNGLPEDDDHVYSSSEVMSMDEDDVGMDDE